MPKLHTYCPPNAYTYTQETRESNNISGTFQHFLLTEMVSFPTANLIFCLLELMKENSWCKNCCCTRPLSLTSLGGGRLVHLQRESLAICKGVWESTYNLEFAKAFQPCLLCPTPYAPQIKSTEDIKNKARRLFWKHKTYKRYKYIWENILQQRIFSISWRRRQVFLLSQNFSGSGFFIF